MTDAFPKGIKGYSSTAIEIRRSIIMFSSISSIYWQGKISICSLTPVFLMQARAGYAGVGASREGQGSRGVGDDHAVTRSTISGKDLGATGKSNAPLEVRRSNIIHRYSPDVSKPTPRQY